MRSKRWFVGTVVAVVALVLCSGSVLLASNMGFKLNRLLQKPLVGTSKTGQHFLALPYFRQTGLNKAGDLYLDMGGSPYIQRVTRLLEATDLVQSYTGVGAVNNFNLEDGVGYQIQIKSTAPGDLNYIVVGSHNPALAVSLDKPSVGVSKTGVNWFAMPYNFTGAKAGDLYNDIGGSAFVQRVTRLLTATDLVQSYTGVAAVNNFTLDPGVAYIIQIKSTAPSTVNYIASHY